MSFKETNPNLSVRVSESTKVRSKHPNKVPIICERSRNASESCPTCNKEKFLAQSTLTISKFAAAVQKQLKTARGSELFVNVFHKDREIIPEPQQLLEEIDCKYRDPDGYLYVRYSDVYMPESSELTKPEPEAAPVEAITAEALMNDEPAPSIATLPAECNQLRTGGGKCMLKITGEEWVWAMTDPRWEFRLELQASSETLCSCSKRYSEFQELENKMCAELGEAAWPKMPRLPAAHTVPGIGKLFDTAEVAQQRREELHQYIQDLLCVPGACASEALHAFMLIDPDNKSLEFVSANNPDQ